MSTGRAAAGVVPRALLAAGLAAGLWLTSAPANASAAAPSAPEGPLAVTLPNHWIAGWGHGTVGCADFTSLPWVFWRTYAEGRVGDRWVMDASSRSLCAGATRTARSIIKRQPQHLGATLDRAVEELFGSAAILRGGTPAPLGALAPGYACYVLPPSYQVGFEQERRILNSSEPAEAQAVGISASYVICLTHARLRGKKLSGASYFTFGPRATDCALTYNIKLDRPNPEEPGGMMAPKVEEATIPGDYSEGACAAIPGGP